MKNKITKNSGVTFAELSATQFGILNGDIRGDMYSLISSPSRANPLLIGILKEDGWNNVQEINQGHHGINGKLSERNFRRIFNSDTLLISSISRNAPPSMQLANLYKSVNPEGITIAGGFDPTFRTREWLNHVDIVVRGEGDKTLPELMERLVEDRENLDGINGISYKNRAGKIVDNPDRLLLTEEEMNNLPLIHYDATTRRNITTSPLETSRGCPHDCDFCTVDPFYRGRFRNYSLDHVLAQYDIIKDIRKPRSFVNNIFLTADNMNGNPKRAIAVFDALASRNPEKSMLAQVTVQAAYNQELLDSMRSANVRTLCVGIESIFDDSLEGHGKAFDSKKNREAVKIFRESGFWVHGMMIAGGDYDTVERMRETKSWINENLDSLQIFPKTPLPGSKYGKKMDEAGRVLTKDMSLYDCQHVVIRPENMTPYELQEEIRGVYESFYSWGNTFRRNGASNNRVKNLAHTFFAKHAGGLKGVFESPQYKNHSEFLKAVS